MPFARNWWLTAYRVYWSPYLCRQVQWNVMIIIVHKYHDPCTSLDGKKHGLNKDVMVLLTCIVIHLIDYDEKGRLVFAPQ